MARSEGLQQEFEGVQQLRHGNGLNDKWDLAALPPRLKEGVLRIRRDSDETLQEGLEFLIQLIDASPPRDKEILDMSFNIGGRYGQMGWMSRSDDFAETCSWCSSGRTVRQQSDQAILNLLRRTIGNGLQKEERPTQLSIPPDKGPEREEMLAVEVTTSPRAYKIRILPVEANASTIDRIPKRISVYFKDPETVANIAAQRFGPGSSSVNHYVQEHHERRREFLDALARGRQCREIFNVSELLLYARSRQHGVNVELSPRAMTQTVALWLDAIEQFDAYKVGLTTDPLPFKYELIDSSIVVLHEAVGVADSHRLNGIFIRDRRVAEQFQADFDVIWDNISGDMRSRHGVTRWIRTTLLPELQPSLNYEEEA